MPCSVVINPYSFGGVPGSSLRFGTLDGLTMSDTDWGSYNRTQFSIIFSAFIPNSSGRAEIFGKGSPSTPSDLEFYLIMNTGSGNIDLELRDSSNTTTTLGSFAVSGGISASTWYAVQLDYDGNLGTAADRVTVRVNDTDLTPNGTYSWPSAINNTSNDVYLGELLSTGGTANANVDLHQFTFITGSNPAHADVFDGSAGKLKNTALLSDIHSRLPATVDAVSDDERPDWTDNGGVTTIASAP